MPASRISGANQMASQRADDPQGPGGETRPRPRDAGAVRCCTGADESEQRRGQDDQRKGQGQEEDGEKGEAGDGPMRRAFQGALGDPQQRLDDDDQHGRLDAEEQRLDEGQSSEGRIDHRERQHDAGAGQDEEQPRRQPAPRPMEPPAGVSRELHRLGPRQQHAEAERIEIERLGQPFLLIDEDAMHEGDLRGRAAEGEQPDARPGSCRFRQAGGSGAIRDRPRRFDPRGVDRRTP